MIDVDGHHFPNLALMRISAYHKSIGDQVEWWFGDLVHYDIVYMSKIFSDAYSQDIPKPMNADKVIKGGTGYCITLENGKEVFDKSKNVSLPQKVEKMFPDYGIYPEHDFAISMTSRWCPRGCNFCHVAAKEGRCSVKVADVSDFWIGQKEITGMKGDRGDSYVLTDADKEEITKMVVEMFMEPKPLVLENIDPTQLEKMLESLQGQGIIPLSLTEDID